MHAVRAMIWFCIWAVLVTSAATAQAPDDKPASGSQKSRPTAARAASADGSPVRSENTAAPVIRGDVVYLPGPDGELVPVPAGTSLQDYLDWLANRNARPPARAAQPFSVTLIALTGTADDERARLNVTIRVRVNDDGWIQVPLRMNEAVLRDISYVGKGDVSYAGHDRDEGHRWWLRGKGLHELTLDVIASVQKPIPARRLQLELPPAAASSLKLTVPIERISLNVPEPAAAKSRPLGKDGSEIEVFGLGTRLDLQWQPIPTSRKVETVLQADTDIDVEITADSAILTATQTVQVQGLQGSFEEISVQLPAGFDLLDCQEKSGRLYSNHTVDPKDPRRVTVQLTEPTTGPVRLVWTLESTTPAIGRQLSLAGFEVDLARRQSGTVTVTSALQGSRVRRVEGEDRYVHRSDVNRATGNRRTLSAYRFLRQPFRLVLDVTEVEPYFTAEPRIGLFLSAEEARLDAVIRIDVIPDRGALQDIQLDWPQLADEGWTLDPIDAPRLVEASRVTVDVDAGTVSIPFVSRMTGNFEVPISARRPLPPGEEPISLSLPKPVAPSRSPSTVIVTYADNVEAVLEPRSGTTVHPVPEDLLPTLALPSGFRGTYFQVASANQVFDALVSVHEKSVAATSRIAIEQMGGTLHVQQLLDYSVSYERVPNVRVSVPKSLQRRVRFQLGELELSPAWTGLESESREQARLPLPEPRHGDFQIQARFLWELGETPWQSDETVATIPLILASDAEFSQLTATVLTEEAVSAIPAGADWKSRPTMAGSSEWVTAEYPTEIPLHLHLQRVVAAERFRISRALIQTAIDQNGGTHSRGTYRIERAPQSLSMSLPPGVDLETIWWDGEELSSERFQLAEPKTRRYVIHPPVADDPGPHLLTINFHRVERKPLEWTSTQEFEAPRFPEHVWIEQTLWQLVLRPYEQHLFLPPDGYAGQFSWVRDGILWLRKPYPRYADLNAWLGASNTTGEAALDEFAQGNRYLFGRFGPAVPLQIRTMNRSLIVLFGAGVALFAGFLLIKVPLTRNVFSVLGVAFALAVAGLWYLPPIQVLLQPALLGLLLAILAGVIDGTLRRPRPSTILTLSSPSDFIGPSGSTAHRHALEEPVSPPVAGSDDITAVRSYEPDAGREPVLPRRSDGHA